ncbi:DUF1840 domain-containing protein [Thiomonas bhubaneswarensis]|uniref:DUF1840 domain-containing protein n=1 Tax=Thiomonas bhubaneswarensis TaxID=339866 RepID=A0A0K6HT26_9BURK|nr:DUF1840 domain-containing protein [Thiomonas bhubaneswarensis]CUA94049.1 Domain of unknown function (DUF1840) [Thiomonas bhubaneswarensis]
MIYKFQSKADSDLFMNVGPAERILSIIGKAGAKGIIEPAEMPAAIAALEAAVNEEEQAREEAANAAAADGQVVSSAQPIGLKQRAWPFIQMLKRCQQADVPVVWGV